MRPTGTIPSEPAAAPRRWAAFDQHWKYRWEEGSSGTLEETLSGLAVAADPDDARAARLVAAWQATVAASPYTGQPLVDGDADQGLLDQRLRDLGYL